MYHAIFDLQAGNYLATGLNTRSLKELFDDYCEYKSGDAFDENEWRNHFNSLSEYEKRDLPNKLNEKDNLDVER